MKAVSIVSILVLALVVITCAVTGDTTGAVGFASTMAWIIIFLIYYKESEKK